ncbi:diguanylate cyclase domain-containing protein [Butyrivibrio fibrisolvens]|uniref:diguanylate cyclase domain-containing protein n=1 Tax=Butyrivibrio fibrisolvens TaxID=831 RepID=UPI0004891996|nr:diguanylate cyclase [Butyrivibrio fibrisolvens]
MRSLRTRITVTMLLIVCGALMLVTFLSAVYIQRTESRESEEILMNMCEAGVRSLDYYFDSVEDTVIKVTDYAENHLEGLGKDDLEAHMEIVCDYFDMMASKTKGVLTYYYRIDPSVSTDVKGFWYVNVAGEGFKEHEVTDITLYDVEDTSKLVWFTAPKHEGKAIWLPPYITENLDAYVISYDAPVYYNDKFIGVVGIEVDYSIMAQEVDVIRLPNKGYAFLSDENGYLFYHPFIDVTKIKSGNLFEIPYDTATGDDNVVLYTYEGVDKKAVWLPLSNGMRFNVSIPIAQTQATAKRLVLNIIICSVEVLILASIFMMIYTKRLTSPLEQLTKAAEKVEKGEYDFTLTYDKDDELGRLTRAFQNLSDNVKEHISNLSSQVFVDSLTHVKNKGALTNTLEQIQKEIDIDPDSVEFAIGTFDCDNLKHINDRYGHDKGDIFLKTACFAISDVFKHSPVFRMGGDEFNVILRKEDLSNMQVLLEQFDDKVKTINEEANKPWEQVWISKGFAVYDKTRDKTTIDVMKRADDLMYENKRMRKAARK